MTLLSTATLTGLVAVVGIILRMAAKRPATHHVGDILLGFAVLMYGMSIMSDAVSPLRDSQVFIDALTSFSNPLLGILVGLLFTSVIQSASAAVGILQALAVTGAITFEIALPIVMGIAIGAAVPVLLSALGANVSGKRTAFVYLLIDMLGVVIWATVFYTVNAIVHFDFLTMTMTAVSIALMNTLFRLATVIVLAPLIGVLEKCVCLLIPENPESVREEQEMARLEERFLLHPALALEQSRQVTDAMAQRAMDNLLRAMELVHRFSDKGCRAVEDTEDAIDRYEDRLGTYLMKITGKELSQRQSEEVSKYLHTISDFERISDHAVNLLAASEELRSKGLGFSAAAEKELKVLIGAVSEILNTAERAFSEKDLAAAAQVEPLKQVIVALKEQMRTRHILRMQQGHCSIEAGFVWSDLLTNLERTSDHCSNIAGCVIDAAQHNLNLHETLRAAHSDTHAFRSEFQRYVAKYALPAPASAQ